MLRESITRGHKSPILCMATGGGKSRLGGKVISLACKKGKKTLFLAHRRKLVDQFADGLKKHFGVEAGFIMDKRDYVIGHDVYCGTVQSVAPRIARGALSGDMFTEPFVPDIIMPDECHLSISDQYTYIYNNWREAIKIGLTGTPCRADDRGLGEVFDDIVDVADTAYLTKKGILSPIRYFAADADDLEKIKTIRNGFYDKKEQNAVFNKPKIVGNVVETWLRIADGRPTLLFACSVQHSINLTREFQSHGINAMHLDARSDDNERDLAFELMEAGKIDIICNYGLYVEGVDVPELWCVQVARKVGSLSAWRQIVGRGIRNPEDPSYPDCFVIDHGGNYDRHGPVDQKVEWSLDGKEIAWRKHKAKGKEVKKVTCKSCLEIFDGGSKCPTCGTELIRYGRKVEVVDGEIKEIGKADKSKAVEWVEKIQVMSGLKWHANSKGYKPAWANNAYRTLFKNTPSDYRIMNAIPVKPEKGSYAHRQLTRLFIIYKDRYKKRGNRN